LKINKNENRYTIAPLLAILPEEPPEEIPLKCNNK
jgi:hypothetical protein